MSYTDWRYVEEYTGPIIGRGIRAAGSIPEGSIIGIYDGVITEFPLKDGALVDPAVHKRIVQVARTKDSLFGLLNTVVSGIDYINHSCVPNISPQNRLILVANRDIEPGEPLTMDYRAWDLVPEGIACWCEPSACRI